MSLEIRIPELSLVVLIGASGSGKSTLARRLFLPTEILSSDICRGWVSDDENNMESTGDAFEVLHFLARKRLARGRLTVVDATNVRPEDRKPLVQIAREFHCLPVAIVIDTPEHVCHERNRSRPDRDFGPHVVRNHRIAMRRGLRGLQREGFRHVYTLRSEEECATATLVREPLWNNLRHECGPFDIIGDVHGCYDELLELLKKLGWIVTPIEGQPEGMCEFSAHAAGGTTRKLVFVGDLVDRGPKTPEVRRIWLGKAARTTSSQAGRQSSGTVCEATHAQASGNLHGCQSRRLSGTAVATKFRHSLAADQDGGGVCRVDPANDDRLQHEPGQPEHGSAQSPSFD